MLWKDAWGRWHLRVKRKNDLAVIYGDVFVMLKLSFSHVITCVSAGNTSLWLKQYFEYGLLTTMVTYAVYKLSIFWTSASCLILRKNYFSLRWTFESFTSSNWNTRNARVFFVHLWLSADFEPKTVIKNGAACYGNIMINVTMKKWNFPSHKTCILTRRGQRLYSEILWDLWLVFIITQPADGNKQIREPHGKWSFHCIDID